MLARVSLRKAMTRAALLVATLTLAFVAEAPQARADFVEWFILCTNCGGDPQAVEGTVTIDDLGDSGDGNFEVLIDFTSDEGKLLDVYFETAQWAGLTLNSVTSSPTGTNYVSPATPAEPPAAGSISSFGGAWLGTAIGFTADPSSSPPSITGVTGGFDAVLTFSFSGLGLDVLTFATSVLSTFDQGFRIAMHIGDCTVGGESCTAIAAPIPGAVWLFISALLGLVGIGYLKREKLAAA